MSEAPAMRAVAMGGTPETRAAEIARGMAVKRRNAITAILTGGTLSFLAARMDGFEALGTSLFPRLLAGVLVGLLYANAFEYVLHRFLLHWGNGFLVQRHALHHDSTGADDEARYVNFATAPLVVVGLFVANAAPLFLLDHFSRAALAPGALIAFTIYYLLYEEIHWRFHLGGWLPRPMRKARQHHLLHHGDFEGRYNVFLPLCDWLFHRGDWKRRQMANRATADGATVNDMSRTK
jgi:Fatty acid hydroxylase superfamily